MQELRSFLGLINYYGKFIQDLATFLYQLNQLLQANKKWEWTTDCTQGFQAAKDLLHDKGGEGIHIFNMSQLQSLPVTFKNMRQATKNDPKY